MSAKRIPRSPDWDGAPPEFEKTCVCQPASPLLVLTAEAVDGIGVPIDESEKQAAVIPANEQSGPGWEGPSD